MFSFTSALSVRCCHRTRTKQSARIFLQAGGTPVTQQGSGEGTALARSHSAQAWLLLSYCGQQPAHLCLAGYGATRASSSTHMYVSRMRLSFRIASWCTMMAAACSGLLSQSGPSSAADASSCWLCCCCGGNVLTLLCVCALQVSSSSRWPCSHGQGKCYPHTSAAAGALQQRPSCAPPCTLRHTRCTPDHLLYAVGMAADLLQGLPHHLLLCRVKRTPRRSSDSDTGCRGARAAGTGRSCTADAPLPSNTDGTLWCMASALTLYAGSLPSAVSISFTSVVARRVSSAMAARVLAAAGCWLRQQWSAGCCWCSCCCCRLWPGHQQGRCAAPQLAAVQTLARRRNRQSRGGVVVLCCCGAPAVAACSCLRVAALVTHAGALRL